MCEVEVGVHLDHLPAAVAVLVDSYEEAGIVLLAPLDVKVRRLGVARNHVPGGEPAAARRRASDQGFSTGGSPPTRLPSGGGPICYLFLSSGSAGTALWSGASSSSWEMTSLAFTCTPEILKVGPLTFPRLPPDEGYKRGRKHFHEMILDCLRFKCIFFNQTGFGIVQMCFGI